MRRAFLFAALLVASLAQSQEFVMAPEGPYRPEVPRPNSVGLRPSTFLEQEAYLEALAKAAPDRVQIREFGKSTQGRRLRIAVVGPVSQLDDLQKRYQAQAKGEPQANLPALVWINESIHGDEAASFESGMWLLYNLVASESPRIKAMREQAVVIVNPCYNPDGHERYSVWYNALPIGSANPASPEHREPRNVNGRTNAFGFDMNRDRVAMSQAESRAEVAEFMRWHPQVYVDQHGEVETYFFPPAAMAVNQNVDRARYEKWTQAFGRASAAAFDKRGYGYYVREIFDLYYPGYLDSFTSLTGAIGMTHETDAAAVRLRNGDGTERTLLGAMSKHLTAALAVIESAGQKKEELQRDFVAFRKEAMDASKLGENRFVVMGSSDRAKAQKLSDQLSAMGVENQLTEGRGEFNGTSLWTGKKESAKFSGSYVTVDLAQPNGMLARAMLDPKSDFEPEFAKDPSFYDMTAWAIPFLYGVEAWFAEKAPSLNPIPRPMVRVGASTVGYAVRPSVDSARQLIELGRLGYRVQLSPDPMKLGDREFPANTALVMANKNEPELFAKLASSELNLEPLTTQYPEEGSKGPGSESILSLKAPKIALSTGTSQSPTGFGQVWFWLTQEKMEFTPLASLSNLSTVSVLLVPDGESSTASSVREWVSAGGCLVVLGNSFGAGSLWEMGSTKSVRPVPGAIGQAEIDQSSWLAAGVTDPVAVPLDGGSFAEDDSAVVRATGRVLSGWKWDDTEKGVTGAAAVRVFEVGKGHVVVFAADPTDRAMWVGLQSFLRNAIAYGPRM